MRRLVLVFLFVLTSMAAWAPGLSAQDDDLPDAPQAKGDSLEFSIEGAILDDQFGSPLNWGPNEDGRQFLLVTIEVKNTGNESRTLNSDEFRIVDGRQFIPADDGLSKRPAELGIPAMGDVLGDVLEADQTQLYILGWRLEPDIDEFLLDINYGSAKRVDLQPWMDLDIDPADLRPEGERSTTSTRTTSRPTETDEDESAITGEEEEYLLAVTTDAVLLGEAGGELAELFEDAANDEYLFLDQDWQVDVGSQLGIFLAVDRRAQSLTPSARQAPIHDLWLSLTASAASAANNYALGIDTLDPNYLYAANEDLATATDLSEDVLASIEAFIDDPASFEDSGSTSRSSTSVDAPVVDCTPFATYEEAQDYYAENPDAQIYIDPDFDGLACEVYFGRG